MNPFCIVKNLKEEVWRACRSGVIGDREEY